MISVYDTAYPRLKPRYSTRDITHCYTPTQTEMAFCIRHTNAGTTQLGLLVLLKTFQRLGYFIRASSVPEEIIAHIAQSLGASHSQEALSQYDQSRVRKDHVRLVRDYLQVNAFSAGGETVLRTALREAAVTKEDLADIINVGIETLVRFRYELPAFSTIVREAGSQRAAAYHDLFVIVYDRLGETGRFFLDALFITDPRSRTSPWNDLKQEPPKPTLRAARTLLRHYQQMSDLSRYHDLLEDIPLAKIKQWAIEAKSLDATSMANIEPYKRYALILSLIRMQCAQIADDLCQVFIKQMGRIRANAKEKLAAYLEQNQHKTDEIVRRYSKLDEVLHSQQSVTEKLSHIHHIVTSRPDLCTYSRDHAEFGGKDYRRFMWTYFKPRRAVLLNMLEHLHFVSTSQDESVLPALSFVLAYRHKRHEWLSIEEILQSNAPPTASLGDLSWVPDRWWKLITGSSNRDAPPVRINRRHFEVLVCTQLIRELQSGDICVSGSDAYSDYRTELLPMETCQETLAQYGEQVGLPVEPQAFITHLKAFLAGAASKAEKHYPDNDHFELVDGEPQLKRPARRPVPETLDDIERRLFKKLETYDLNILDVLTETMEWLRWGRFFGPLSGYQSKLQEEEKRYILTVFAYGTGLGPTQAAKAVADINMRQISFVNQRHITSEKLDLAIRDIVNAYNKFELPRYWGDTTHAAADGTKWDLYDNNLLSEYHIRYGGYGGIAYYHVSDTYIALFSHFIPCGVWEAVYILDGLTRNQSDMQPDILHGDTQAQSEPVYGLAFMLGIKLLPRIRNWKKLKYYKPDPELTYQYIEDLFTNDRINWDLIFRHLPDMFQVAQSIKAGRINPSTILRKLGTASRKNKLYYAFRELGRVVRTAFLLEYITDEQLRKVIHEATNKCEEFNKFAAWAYFGAEEIRENVRDEQVKIVKYNHLMANLLIFHNVYSMTRTLKEMEQEGIPLTPEELRRLSPYRTGHINRFGAYELRDREVAPVDYGLKLETSPISQPSSELPCSWIH